MNTIRLLIFSTAMLGLSSLSNTSATAAESARTGIMRADWQKLAREAVELAKAKDPKTRQANPAKLRLKDGTTCTLEIGRNRQARCAENGQGFNALSVQCNTMPPQLRARCDAAQSTTQSKER